MTLPIKTLGMALQLQVDDISRARDFYTAVLGFLPELEPHDDFVEWRISPGGEAWLQAVGVADGVHPLESRVRFGVADVRAERRRLLGLGIDVSRVTSLPGLVTFINFTDPWGNKLGFYEDVPEGDRRPAVGGSVHDATIYVFE